jgi:hypothetical protein
MRTLQEWLGHLDARTTQIYADYMPDAREQAMVDEAFGGPPDSKRTPFLGEQIERDGH